MNPSGEALFILRCIRRCLNCSRLSVLVRPLMEDRLGDLLNSVASHLDDGRVEASSLSTTGFTNTTKSGTAASVSVTIGSNRPRIRMVTKPPVPKQPPLSFGVPAVESQGHVRVVAAQDSRGFLSSNANTEETAAQRLEDAESQINDGGLFAVKKPVVATAPAMHGIQTTHDVKHRDEPAQDFKLVDTTKAAATAFSALEQRSRSLMKTSDALSSQWAASVGSSLSTNKATTMRPETSHSPSSPAKSPAMSSSSASSSDSDSERSRMATIQQQRTGNLTARAVPVGGEPLASTVRRRVASAGPIRQKPNPSLSTALAHKQAGGHTTFVGSTTSLIRAQRATNGQSLADSADEMVATMAANREDRQEVRDESGGGSVLKNQRSMTQLNQVDPGAKKPSKKLTVPKSPKFSVMSWQKKKEMGAAARTGHVVSRR